MAFHVTQCPGCDSTFNTSARLLETAHGRVRCGACLAVFDAAENFIETDQDNDGRGGEESVFVGNNPLDYFDPSVFLTRAALTEFEESDVEDGEFAIEDGESTIEEQTVDSIESTIETPGHQQLDQDFFAAVADEMQQPSQPPEPPDPPELKPHTNLDSTQPSPSDAAAPAATNLQFSDPSEHATDFQSFTTWESWDPDSIHPIPSDADTPAPADQQLIESPEHEADFQSFTPAESSFPDSIQPSPTDAVSPEITQHQESFSATEAGEIEDFDSKATAEAGQAEQVSSRLAGLKQAISYLLPNAVQKQQQEHRVAEEPVEIPNQEAPKDIELSVQDQLEREFLEAVSDNDEQENLTAEEAETVVDLEDLESPLDTEFSDDSISDSSVTVDWIESDYQESHSEEEVEAEAAVEASMDEVEEDSTEAIRARALQTELRDEDALEAIPEENLASLSKVVPALELTSRRESRWVQSSLLSLVALILLSILTAQYLWRSMPLYSQNAQVRPLYEWTCQWAVCELPAYSDIDAIRSDNLAVRSHPEYSNGLMLNIVFRNTADFPQAFPILVLSFNTATNDMVALREFAPSEYLDSSLQNLSLMPVMSPVQVDLELIDPGPDAVNYTLAFRRP